MSSDPTDPTNATGLGDATSEEPRGRSDLDGTAVRLTVYIGESDTWHHKPLYTELVHRAHRSGLAGASVFRGIEGFGSSSPVVHTSRLLSLSDDLPIAVVVIDAAERIEAFLPQVEEIVGEGLVTLDDVRVVVHRHRDDPA